MREGVAPHQGAPLGNAAEQLSAMMRARFDELCAGFGAACPLASTDFGSLFDQIRAPFHPQAEAGQHEGEFGPKRWT